MELQETSILPINLFHPAPQTGAKKMEPAVGVEPMEEAQTSQHYIQ